MHPQRRSQTLAFAALLFARRRSLHASLRCPHGYGLQRPPPLPLSTRICGSCCSATAAVLLFRPVLRHGPENGSHPCSRHRPSGAGVPAPRLGRPSGAPSAHDDDGGILAARGGSPPARPTKNDDDDDDARRTRCGLPGPSLCETLMRHPPAHCTPSLPATVRPAYQNGSLPAARHPPSSARCVASRSSFLGPLSSPGGPASVLAGGPARTAGGGCPRPPPCGLRRNRPCGRRRAACHAACWLTVLC